jgi:hypothetical protein
LEASTHKLNLHLTAENSAAWRSLKPQLNRGDVTLICNQALARYFQQIRDKKMRGLKEQGLDPKEIIEGSNGGTQ